MLFIVGARARLIAEVNYRTDKVIERGRDVMAKKQRTFRSRTEEESEGSDIEVEEDFIDDDEGASDPKTAALSYRILESDRATLIACNVLTLSCPLLSPP
jgi:hypothetical protein